jgi:RND family efflux transporter MFP subunit
MKKIIYIILAVALVAIVAFQLMSNKKVTEKRVYKYDKSAAVDVNVEVVDNKAVEFVVEMTGNFLPYREVKLNTEVQGKIASMLVDEGDVVRKGQTLIQIDVALLKLQLEAVEIQISGLEVDVKRFKILSDADAIQGVKLEKAELGLLTVKNQRKTIQEQINKSTIRAPFDGVITMKFVEVGSFAAPGVPLLQITDISKLKFTVNATESQLSLFQKDKSYKLFVDAYPALEMAGKVSMVGSKGNMSNNYPVIFEVNNTKDWLIKAGMFGKFKSNRKTQSDEIYIDTKCLIGSSTNPQVYVVENGVAKLKKITISERIGEKVVVSDGLKLGDTIVTSGFINLFDNANVSVSK